MKAYGFIFSVFLMLLCSNLSFAAAWSDDLVIESVIAEDGDIVIVNTSGGTIYTQGCLANRWIFRAANDGRLNRVYSALMTALAGSKKVNFWYKDSCDSWGYHGFSSVQVNK